MDRTKGQIQDSITKQAITLYKELLGTGPKNIRTYIIDDMVIIRSEGKLLPIEKILLEGRGGVEMVKDLRKVLHERTTEQFSKIIEKETERKVVSSHSDISTKSGEIVKIFILDISFEKELIKLPHNS